MSSPARQAILDRVRKLSAMTPDAGCTEQEALTALQMLSKLMAEHQVTQSELEIRQSVGRECNALAWRMFNDSGAKPIWRSISSPIADLFGVKTWRKDGVDQSCGIPMYYVDINFYGLPEDAEAAAALTRICVQALIQDGQAWIKAHHRGRGKSEALYSFHYGMVSRLTERIEAQASINRAARATGGTSLIVLKDQLVSGAWATYCREQGLSFRKTYASLPSNRAAAAAGLAAGARVSLGPTPTSSSNRLALPGRPR